MLKPSLSCRQQSDLSDCTAIALVASRFACGSHRESRRLQRARDFFNILLDRRVQMQNHIRILLLESAQAELAFKQ